MEYEIKPKDKLSLGLKELWIYRELFYFFTWRDIKVKYKQTFLGILWIVIQPVIMSMIFTYFFKTHFHLESGRLPYALYVFSGLIPWNIFSSGISNSGNSMINNANILKKIYFPRLIIPISAVLVSVFDAISSIVVFTFMLIYFNVQIDFSFFLFYLPVSIIITTLSTFGIGSLLSALNVKYRDFRYLIPFFIQALMFLTPVIYPISVISNNTLKYFLSINPIYSAIEILRMPFSNCPPDYIMLLISLGSCVFFLITGILFFKKTEYYFADLV